VGLFDDPLGTIFGGDSSSSASVTSNTTLDIKGLDNIKETLTLAGATTITENLNLGGQTTVNENIKVDPLSITQKMTDTIELKPVTFNENVDLQPVSLSADLKPVALDSCQTLKIAPLPDTHVCQPYQHHVAYTLFGLEFFGVTYDGESKQIVTSPRRPQVIQSPPPEQHHRPHKEIGSNRGIRVRALDPDDK